MTLNVIEATVGHFAGAREGDSVKLFKSFAAFYKMIERSLARLPGGPGLKVCLCGLIALLILGGGFYLVLVQRDPAVNLAEGYYGVAFNQYQGLAQSGDNTAITVIGNLYLLGLGVRESKIEAARWYLKAALAGHGPAQINLGQLYWSGIGVPRRLDKAVGWFYLAKQSGYERAEGHLRYIGGTNSILPLMFDDAVLKFNNLARVKKRYQEKGETAFLMD